MSQDRFERWHARQEELAARLRAWGAGGHEYRVDLETGRFWWLDANGLPSAEAECKAIASYALSNNSVLMAWEVDSLRGAAAIEPVEGIPHYLEDAAPGDAWALTLLAADACGCDYVYRAPGAQTWLFLGLWNVRRVAGDAPVSVSGTPQEHVRDVLVTLIGALVEEPDRWRVLARNYGTDIVESSRYTWRGTASAETLRAVGTALIALSTTPCDVTEARKELLRLHARAFFPDDAA
ncbi:MAG: DUF6882 domain-containing protein [Myxococcota bacterium]